MKKRILGIIGGSGLYNIDGLENIKWKKVNTNWGLPSDKILSATLNKIEVYLIGRLVPETVIELWRNELKENSNLTNTTLEIFQAADQSGDMAQELSGKLKFDILDELYEKNEQLLKDKEAKIKFLEEKLTSIKVKELRFDDISREVKMNYNEIQSISYYNKVTTDFETTDTIPVFSIKWDTKYLKSSREKDTKSLSKWLKYKLKLDTLLITY